MKRLLVLVLATYLAASCVTMGDSLLYIKQELAHEECELVVYTVSENPKQEISRRLSYGERRGFVGVLPLQGRAYCPNSNIVKEITFTTHNGQKELVFKN